MITDTSHVEINSSKRVKLLFSESTVLIAWKLVSAVSNHNKIGRNKQQRLQLKVSPKRAMQDTRIDKGVQN